MTTDMDDSQQSAVANMVSYSYTVPPNLQILPVVMGPMSLPPAPPVQSLPSSQGESLEMGEDKDVIEGVFPKIEELRPLPPRTDGGFCQIGNVYLVALYPIA